MSDKYVLPCTSKERSNRGVLICRGVRIWRYTGGKKREINFSSPLEVVPLVARISRKTEVPSTLTLRVEVKEPTDDAKHFGSDHRQGISAKIFRILPLLRHLRERNK